VVMDQNHVLNFIISELFPFATGSFAGNAAIFAETCNGTCTDLVAEPSNYE